jgi:magnesium transporter
MVWRSRSPKRSRPNPSAPPPDAAEKPASVGAATVNCGAYVNGERVPGDYGHDVALDTARRRRADGDNAFVWVGLYQPDEQQMATAADVFGLHPLTTESATHAHSRPRLDRYGDTLTMVLKTFDYVDHDSLASARSTVTFGEIMIVVGAHFVVTVRQGRHGALADVRRRMDGSPVALRLGPYAVLHAIAEHVLETYSIVADRVQDDVDALQANVFTTSISADLERAYLLKREVIEMRRAVEPLVDSLAKLLTDYQDLVSLEVRRYIRDVRDRAQQITDRVVEYDDVLDSLLEAALGRVATQQNVDMRKISAWAALAAVPTMVAGIYGMRFGKMPELHFAWSYAAVMIGMVAVCGFLYYVFRRIRWL